MTKDNRASAAPQFEPDIDPGTNPTCELHVFPNRINTNGEIEWAVDMVTDGGAGILLTTCSRANAILFAAEKAVEFGVPISCRENVRLKSADIVQLRPKLTSDWSGEW